jgi:hypothetical protein
MRERERGERGWARERGGEWERERQRDERKRKRQRERKRKAIPPARVIHAAYSDFATP